jgi:hypothetical protein
MFLPINVRAKLQITVFEVSSWEVKAVIETIQKFMTVHNKTSNTRHHDLWIPVQYHL